MIEKAVLLEESKNNILEILKTIQSYINKVSSQRQSLGDYSWERRILDHVIARIPESGQILTIFALLRVQNLE